jgi:hypothetical protein
MRKSFWIIPAVLFVVIGVPNAHADSFTATFTCTGSCSSTPSSTTGTFTPSGPNSLGAFTWDTVSWGPFILPADWLPTDSYSWVGFLDTTATGATNFLTFRITDLNVSPLLNIVQSDKLCPTLQACQTNFDFGVLSFSPVTTPEPRSVALLLAGIALLLVMRKR